MNGICKNTNGSFECECPKGYVYSRSSGKCLDVNECEDSSPCKNAKCVNTPGSFKCECTEKGHTLDSTGRICRGLCVIFDNSLNVPFIPSLRSYLVLNYTFA